MSKHYHLFTLAVGKDQVERVYIEVKDPDNPGTEDEATEAFLDKQIEGRQRNRDKAKNQIRSSIISYKLCRPSSWNREHGIGGFAINPPTTKSKVKRGEEVLKTNTPITLELVKYGWFGGDRQDAEITIMLVPATHWNSSNPKMKAYEIFDVGGNRLGKISRSIENTDRHYGRIRVPGKGRLAWKFESRLESGRVSRPGTNEPNQLTAIARMLGYDSAKVIS